MWSETILKKIWLDCIYRKKWGEKKMRCKKMGHFVKNKRIYNLLVIFQVTFGKFRCVFRNFTSEEWKNSTLYNDGRLGKKTC